MLRSTYKELLIYRAWATCGASEEKSQENQNNTEEVDIVPARTTVPRSKQVSCFGPVNLNK